MCILVLFIISYFFLLYTYLKFNICNKFNAIYFYNNNINIILLIYIGGLSVNVTLLYPLVLIEQLYCLYIISIIVYKIL